MWMEETDRVRGAFWKVLMHTYVCSRTDTDKK